MAIKTDNPLLVLLRGQVEKKFGVLRTSYDFVRLASCVEADTHEHISESTLKRVWGYVSPYATVTPRTLGVLCRYIGCSDWDAWRRHLAEEGVVESETVSAPGSVSSSDLKAGDRVLICWSPDRECVIEYLGDGLFRAERTLNSKLKAGDTFFCRRFIKGRPLYVDDLTTRDGVFFESYAMGTEYGLSQVRVL